MIILHIKTTYFPLVKDCSKQGETYIDERGQKKM